MRTSLLMVAVVLAVGISGAAHGAERPHYDITLRVSPDAGTIEARVEITSPGASSFVLGRDLALTRVLADDVRNTVREQPPHATDGTREVILSGSIPTRLVVEYAGPIRAESYPRLVSQVNAVRPTLVELASYVAWYPRLPHAGSFTFRLVADLPEGFVTVTNARAATDPVTRDDRVTTEWLSRGPVSDIALVAAKGLRTYTRPGDNSAAVEVYASTLPAAYVESMASDISSTLGLLTAFAGAPPPEDLVRVVYSPRPGWGYVRPPLIVVSEESAALAMDRRDGRARDLRYIAHEVAHYWWHLADTNTPEDWINEGLAEYSALLVSRTLFGTEFADALLEDYRQRSENGTTSLGDSRNRQRVARS